MNEILLLKTFTLVGGMLLLTTIGARLNKDFETKAEGIITFSGIILFIILVNIYGNEFPMNIFCLGCVSLFVGWGIGPAITGLGKKFKFRKYLDKIGVQTKRVEENLVLVGCGKDLSRRQSIISKIHLKSFMKKIPQRCLSSNKNSKRRS